MKKAIGGSVQYMISLFIICASLFGQQAVPDVDGWIGTKWDMTLAQVNAALGEYAERDAFTDYDKIF